MRLNSDLGEGFDEADARIMPLIDLANIACGGHAGNRQTMNQAVSLACRHNVLIGAHPSYPDRANFGRQSLELPFSALEDSLTRQIHELADVCREQGTQPAYIKPHGALYNDLVANPERLTQVMEICRRHFPALPLMMQATAEQQAHRQQAEAAGLTLWFEAFADRRYTPEGLLQPRSEAGAVLHDPDDAFAQARLIIERSGVYDSHNQWLNVRADSLCVHGDTEGAARAVQRIRALLPAR